MGTAVGLRVVGEGDGFGEGAGDWRLVGCWVGKVEGLRVGDFVGPPRPGQVVESFPILINIRSTESSPRVVSQTEITRLELLLVPS